MAWNQQDCAAYISTLKSFENKPPDAIKEQVDSNHFSQINRTLTTIKSVNKTDILTLSSHFKTLRDVVVNGNGKSMQHLTGFGDQKIKRVCDAFDQPFLRET